MTLALESVVEQIGIGIDRLASIRLKVWVQLHVSHHIRQLQQLTGIFNDSVGGQGIAL